MKQIRTISLDLDGTLAKYLSATFAHVAQKGGNLYSIHDVTSWHYEEYMTPKDAEVAAQFAMEPSNYANLELIDGAHDAVMELWGERTVNSLGQTWPRIVVSSKRPDGALPYTQKWLEKNDIPYDALRVSKNAKPETRDQYRGEGPIIFIDDDPKTIKYLELDSPNPPANTYLVLIATPLLRMQDINALPPKVVVAGKVGDKAEVNWRATLDLFKNIEKAFPELGKDSGLAL